MWITPTIWTYSVSNVALSYDTLYNVLLFINENVIELPYISSNLFELSLPNVIMLESIRDSFLGVP